MNKARIVIGICTYKRPEMLKRALLSIGDMEKPDECNFSLIVVDNDPSGSARDIVEKMKSRIQISVYYFVEKSRGIPFARNRILHEAKVLTPDCLSFIDDDQFVDQKWFVNFWNFFKYSKGDVAVGFVKTVYPENSPAWIIKNNFFQRDKISSRKGSTLYRAVEKIFVGENWNHVSDKKTGEIKYSGRTGNCIFNYKKLVLELGLTFNEGFGLMGGSDAEFFQRAIHKGVVIQWVENAVVYEILHYNRMKLSYFLKGIFQTHNHEHEKKRRQGSDRLKLLIRASVIGFFGFLSIPVNIFRGKCYFCQTLKAITISLALLFSAFNLFISWEQYK